MKKNFNFLMLMILIAIIAKGWSQTAKEIAVVIKVTGVAQVKVTGGTWQPLHREKILPCWS